MNKKICGLILLSSLFMSSCGTTPSSVIASVESTSVEQPSAVSEYQENWTDSDKSYMYEILGDGVTIPFMEISDYIIMNNFLDDDTPMTEFYSTTADIDDLNAYKIVLETYYTDYKLVAEDTDDAADPFYVFEKDMGDGVVISLNIGLYEFVKDELHFDVYAYLDTSSETVSGDIEIASTDFYTGYSDEQMNFSGMDLQVTNIMQNVQDNTIQFSSSKKRDAGKMVTTVACSAVNTITIEQDITGYDGELSVKTSADGITYTALADQETNTDNIFEFSLGGATYFEISNTSSTNAIYLNSISIDLLDF